jgi:hypothetical protein
MHWKKIVSIIVMALGGLMLGASFYIMNQVDAGREQIAAAEDKIEQGKRLFGLNPITNVVGDSLAESAQKKLDTYSEEADTYAALARNLKVGGILFLVIGAIALFSFRKK